MFVNLPLGGLRVQTSEHVGELVVPPYPHPERLKRYKKRTIKRWERKNPPYYRANGTYYILGGRTVVCHPDDYLKLKVALQSEERRTSVARVGQLSGWVLDSI